MSETIKDTDLRVRVAEAAGTNDRWTLKKRGYYFRHEAKGYTDREELAWVLTRAEADKWDHDPEIEVVKLPPPDYPNDLNACAKLRAGLSEMERRMYVNELMIEVMGYAPNSIAGDEEIFAIVNATAEQHCRAFLAAKGVKL